MTYRIKDWDKTFENYRSRAVEDLRWVSFPTRQDSESFRLLMASPEGREAYTVFVVLVQIAAKLPKGQRGTLEDDKGALTPKRVAARVGIPLPIIEQAFELLASPDIGWLIPCDGGPDRCVDAPERRVEEMQQSTIRASSVHRSSIDGASTAHRPTSDRTRPDQKGTEKKRPDVPRPHARTGEEHAPRSAGQFALALTGSGLAGQETGEEARGEVGASGRLGGPDASAEGQEQGARRALARYGIGEPALSVLLEAGVTAEQVTRTRAEVLNDQTVRDATRVLVSRLCMQLEVELPRRRGMRARSPVPQTPVPEGMRDVVGKLEELRRRA